MRKTPPLLTAFVLLLASVPAVLRAAGTVAPEVEPFPVCFALFDPVQFPVAESDVTGFRLSLFYGRSADVMGLDVGALVSAADGDMFGLECSGLVNSVGSSSGSLQIAGIANNCYENFYGLQLSGIANKAGGNVVGGQIGCFNLAADMDGLQIGVYNKSARTRGLQIGVINEAASMRGVQIGLVNIIHDGEVPCLPIVNMQF